VYSGAKKKLLEAYVCKNFRAGDSASDFMPLWKLNFQVNRLQIKKKKIVFH
jgi:hypothetical protein